MTVGSIISGAYVKQKINVRVFIVNSIVHSHMNLI